MKKMIFIAILVAGALSLSVLESAIPLPFIAPGAKLGLSNMVILVTLVIFGFKEALTVSVLKSILLMLVTGSVSSLLYSLAGAVVSSIAMFLTYRTLTPGLSLIGVSMMGAVAHNFAQIGVASLMTQNLLMFTYFPILLIIGLFTGYFVGLSSIYITNQLKKHQFLLGEDYDK